MVTELVEGVVTERDGAVRSMFTVAVAVAVFEPVSWAVPVTD